MEFSSINHTGLFHLVKLEPTTDSVPFKHPHGKESNQSLILKSPNFTATALPSQAGNSILLDWITGSGKAGPDQTSRATTTSLSGEEGGVGPVLSGVQTHGRIDTRDTASRCVVQTFRNQIIPMSENQYLRNSIIYI